MAKISHSIQTENEMTALADDLRGWADLIDVCNESDVHVIIDLYHNIMTLSTEEIHSETAQFIKHTIERIAPVFVEIKEG